MKYFGFIEENTTFANTISVLQNAHGQAIVATSNKGKVAITNIAILEKVVATESTQHFKKETIVDMTTMAEEIIYTALTYINTITTNLLERINTQFD